MYYQNVEKNTREKTELENSSEINKVRDRVPHMKAII